MSFLEVLVCSKPELLSNLEISYILTLALCHNPSSKFNFEIPYSNFSIDGQFDHVLISQYLNVFFCLFLNFAAMISWSK